MPTEAASPGASLMPSPTKSGAPAPLSASCCSRWRAFSSGRHPPRAASAPTARATASATGWPSPERTVLFGARGRRAPPPPTGASARTGSPKERPAHRPVAPGQQDGGPAQRLLAPQPLAQRLGGGPEGCLDPTRAAGPRRPPGDPTPHSTPRLVNHLGGLRQRHVRGQRAAHRLRDGMARPLLERAQRGQRVAAIGAHHLEPGQRGPAGGERAGLVEGDPVGGRHQVERALPAHDDAAPRQRAGRHHPAERRGDAERAGAGDHQHREGPLEGQARAPGRGPPRCAKRQRREHQHAGDEEARQLVGHLRPGAAPARRPGPRDRPRGRGARRWPAPSPRGRGPPRRRPSRPARRRRAAPRAASAHRPPRRC